MPNNESWIDVSVPVYAGMPHWPGDEPFARELMKEIAAGDVCNLSRITLSVHTGTHMDAPLHFIRDAQSMSSMPIEATVGPARVISVNDPESVKPADLEPHNIQPGERILLRTRNSGRAWKNEAFIEDFVYISKEAAAFLAAKKILTVGIDYLSVGGFSKDGEETHHALLGAGIWVIEGLDLSEAPPGRYELVCLPLKLAGAEGSPARAILRKEPAA